MGFDISGLEPKINIGIDCYKLYGMLEQIDDYKQRWAIKDAMSEEDRKQYWKEFEEYHDDNPGVYFRNNCWWWRPLWRYVCENCEDILTKEDMKAGHYNDGKKIDDDKAKKIASKLESLIKDGSVDEYEKEHTEDNKRWKNDPQMKFRSNYPFERSNVERFKKFCEESGGFMIC